MKVFDSFILATTVLFSSWVVMLVMVMVVEAQPSSFNSGRAIPNVVCANDNMCCCGQKCRPHVREDVAAYCQCPNGTAFDNASWQCVSTTTCNSYNGDCSLNSDCCNGMICVSRQCQCSENGVWKDGKCEKKPPIIYYSTSNAFRPQLSHLLLLSLPLFQSLFVL